MVCTATQLYYVGLLSTRPALLTTATTGASPGSSVTSNDLTNDCVGSAQRQV